MQNFSSNMDKKNRIKTPKRIDCAVISACTKGFGDLANDQKELMLIINERAGRHPVQLLPRNDIITWMAQDGVVEQLSIEPSHENFSDVLVEISGRGLLVAELMSDANLNDHEDALRSSAQSATFWLIDSAGSTGGLVSPER